MKETMEADLAEATTKEADSKTSFETLMTSKAEDIDFKANLAKSCATKQKEWDERCKLRAGEIEAISDTIEMMNSDDALELFKKTLPSAASASALIQTAATSRSQMRRASALIRSAMKSDKSHTVR